MSDGNSLALLALGPAGAAGLYWALYRYYRNTDKSHAFERETRVEARPVTGSDIQVGTNNGTQARRIDGDNVGQYRRRVQKTSTESKKSAGDLRPPAPPVPR